MKVKDEFFRDLAQKTRAKIEESQQEKEKLSHLREKISKEFYRIQSEYNEYLSKIDASIVDRSDPNIISFEIVFPIRKQSLHCSVTYTISKQNQKNIYLFKRHYTINGVKREDNDLRDNEFQIIPDKFNMQDIEQFIQNDIEAIALLRASIQTY